VANDSQFKGGQRVLGKVEIDEVSPLEALKRKN